MALPIKWITKYNEKMKKAVFVLEKSNRGN